MTKFLEGLDFAKTISLGEPKRNKDYRNVHFPKRKADAVESHACARFAIVEQPAATPVTPTAFLELREVLSALQSQTKLTTRLINQLHNRLARAFPELAVLVRDLGAKWVLKLLQKYPTARKIAAARLSSIEAIPYLKSEMAQAVHQAAKQSTSSVHGKVVETIVCQLAGEVDQSQKNERRLEELLETAFDALPQGDHVHVPSINGLGKLTAASLVASMVSIDRFASPDSLVNYYGVFPEENTSGTDRRGKPVPPGTMRMCQKGNDLVRKMLYMSCLSAIKTNPAIRALYARKRAENKRGDVALGHCMRKMLHLVFAVWKTGKPFNPQHYPYTAPLSHETAKGERRQGKTETAAAGKEQGSQSKAVTATTVSADRTGKRETAAGRKEQSSERKAVTATTVNVNRTGPSVKPAASAKPSSRSAARRKHRRGASNEQPKAKMKAARLTAPRPPRENINGPGGG